MTFLNIDLKQLLTGIPSEKLAQKEVPKTDTDLSDNTLKNTLDIELDVESPFNTKRLDNLMNIDNAFQKTRLIAILSLCFSFLFCIIVMVIAMQMVTKGKGKIYISNGYGNTIAAYQIGANQNRAAEAKAQVRNFHTKLYNITPDPEVIKDNLDDIMLMGDASIKAFLDKRGDAYYKKLVASDVEVKYQSDSVKVNMNNYPYKAAQYGKEIVQTNVGFLIKKLVTTCELMDVARTDQNPHGLQISNFEILQNERLEFVEMK